MSDVKPFAVSDIGPGETVKIYEYTNLVLPVKPEPVSVKNDSDRCKVKVVAYSGSNVITGDWSVVSEYELDPGKSVDVRVGDDRHFRFKVEVSNLCQNTSATVTYTVGN